MGKVNFGKMPLEEAITAAEKYLLWRGGCCHLPASEYVKILNNCREILKCQPGNEKIKESIKSTLKVIQTEINKEVGYD